MINMINPQEITAATLSRINDLTSELRRDLKELEAAHLPSIDPAAHARVRTAGEGAALVLRQLAEIVARSK